MPLADNWRIKVDIALKKILFLILLAVGFFRIGYSQKKIIGNVVDSASLAPIPGVNIHIKNKYQGTATDAKGFFKMTVGPTDDVKSLTGLSLLRYSKGKLD
jgi:hypothetical protein